VSGSQPRVAVLYSVPILCEALDSALEDIAEVHTFRAGRDTLGLLRAVRPDAIIVDDRDEAEEARRWAKRHGMPVVHVSLQDRTIRTLRDGSWEEHGGVSAEAVRNALAACLYGRKAGA
jgi:hypothetical protein